MRFRLTQKFRELVPWAFGVLLVLLAGQSVAQTTVKVRLDSALMLLGDPNRMVVTVSPEASDVTIGWEVLDTIKAFQSLGDETRQTEQGALKVALPFSVYDSVGLVFPSLPVYLPGETLYTNDVALLVQFPPVDSVFHDFRSLREEAVVWTDYMHWIIAGVVLLLLLLGAFLFFYFAREGEKPVPVPVVIPDPPHVIALRKLDAITASPAADDKGYYSALDNVLREYLEGRYEIPALERTSGEVNQLLKDRDLPDAGELSDLLGQVDLVKFAKAELPLERRTKALERVRNFVLATKFIPPVEPEAFSEPENEDS